MASALASASSVYETDNDPEFVRLAAPSTLKTVEMLLSQAPNHPQLLLTACSGFTEYSVRVPPRRGAGQGRRRGGRRRTWDARRQDVSAGARVCLRGLELRHPGADAQALAADPVAALKATTVEDVPWLYWTAAAWGADLSLAPSQLARIAELAGVRALLNRAKALNDTWEHGAIYEATDRVRRAAAAARRIAGGRARRLRQGDAAVGSGSRSSRMSRWRRRSRIRRRRSGCWSGRWRST